MKRFLAMVLVLCVLFSMQPAFAYAESAPEKEGKTETRTVEEILDEYHQKSLEAELSAEKNAGVSSRSATSGKTLEQETVEELNAAGYEAYNVTSDNYESLERTLKTDFGSMGLDPNGSYIITISGDEENAPNNSNSRGGSLIEQVGGTGDGTGGSSIIEHTYNGTTYTMRYVTVTATDNSDQRMRTYINLSDDYGVEDMWEDLDIYVTLVSSISYFAAVGTLYSWISALLPDIEGTDGELEYFANTNWHIKYIQVYNYQTYEWVTSASTEFVTTSCSLIYAEYDPVTMTENPRTIPGHTSTIYSEDYYNETQMKDYASLAFINHSIWSDTVDDVKHKFDGETVVTHQRSIYWEY